MEWCVAYAHHLTTVMTEVMQTPEAERPPGVPLSRMLAERMLNDLAETMEQVRQLGGDEILRYRASAVQNRWGRIIVRDEAVEQDGKWEWELSRTPSKTSDPDIQVESPSKTSDPDIQVESPSKTSDPDIQVESPSKTSDPDIQVESPSKTSDPDIQVESPIKKVIFDPKDCPEFMGIRDDRSGCWNCGKKDHKRSVCPEPKSNAIYCYGCGKLGKTLATCPMCRMKWMGEGGPFAPWRGAFSNPPYAAWNS